MCKYAWFSQAKIYFKLEFRQHFRKKVSWVSFVIGFRGYILIKSKWFQSSKSLELPVFSSLLPSRVLSCTHKGASVWLPPRPPPPHSPHRHTSNLLLKLFFPKNICMMCHCLYWNSIMKTPLDMPLAIFCLFLF